MRHKKLPAEFKRLDCIYEVWTKPQIVGEDSVFSSALDDEQKILIERHNVVVYGAFLRSAKMWGEFNDDVLKLKKKSGIIKGGLQLASDYMVQGDLILIPLTHAIGYQNNTYIIVHFSDGNPDMGRKVFQPELKALAEAIAVRSVNQFKKYLTYLKPDTGAATIVSGKELYDWKRAQEDYSDRHSLQLLHAGKIIGIMSEPQQEQDVIALFHQLCGAGVLCGYRFYATSQHERYDSLFYVEVESAAMVFDKQSCPLGVSGDYSIGQKSEPLVLEYKFDLDSLVSDFDKEVKTAKHINLVVCWSAGDSFREKYFLRSKLVGDEGSTRKCFGATHAAVSHSGGEEFEIVILRDLVAYIMDPQAEEARHRVQYRD